MCGDRGVCHCSMLCCVPDPLLAIASQCEELPGITRVPPRARQSWDLGLNCRCSLTLTCPRSQELAWIVGVLQDGQRWLGGGNQAGSALLQIYSVPFPTWLWNLKLCYHSQYCCIVSYIIYQSELAKINPDVSSGEEGQSTGGICCGFQPSHCHIFLCSSVWSTQTFRALSFLLLLAFTLNLMSRYWSIQVLAITTTKKWK